MTVTATGHFGLAMENLKSLLSNSSTFQAATGAADAAAALAYIHFAAYNPDGGALDNCFAVIQRAGDESVLVAETSFEGAGVLSILFEKTISAIEDTIDNAVAVDKGGGLVGIPVTGHSFKVDQQVTIAGSINYNDTYAIVSQTANEVVITETFQSETFAGTETITADFVDDGSEPDAEMEFLNFIDGVISDCQALANSAGYLFTRQWTMAEEPARIYNEDRMSCKINVSWGLVPG